MLPVEIKELSLDRLIDCFNQSCDRPNCRFTSRQVNHSWCLHHGPLYDELKRRQKRIIEAPTD
jgi:hypothetical protein